MNVAEESKLKNNIIFFKQKLDEMSVYRMQLLRSKQQINYLNSDPVRRCSLSYLSVPLGYLSFSIYYARLISQCSLLLYCQISKDTGGKLNQSEIALQIFNDALWGTINYIEYFYFTYQISKEHGIKGMQLEVFGQLLDIAVMSYKYVIQLKEFTSEYQTKNDPIERVLLLNDIKYARNNFVRSILHMSVITIVLATIAFPLPFTLPLTPTFYITSLVSGYLRIHWAAEKERGQALILNKPLESKKVNELSIEYLNKHVFFPLALYLSLTTLTLSLAVIFFSILLVKDNSKKCRDTYNQFGDTVLSDKIISYI